MKISQFMLPFILLVTSVVGFPSAQAAVRSPEIIDLSSSNDCILTKTEIQCWSNDRQTLRKLKLPFANPKRFVFSTMGQSCVVADAGVYCIAWMDENEPVVTFDFYDLVESLSRMGLNKYEGYSWGGCVNETHGLQCRGPVFFASEGSDHNDRYTLSDLNARPPLQNLKLIDGNTGFLCAYDDAGLQCWQPKPDGEQVNAIHYPALVNPKALIAGDGSDKAACAIDDSGLRCWQDAWPDKGLKAMMVPPLKNPRSVTIDFFKQLCALDDDGPICWSGRDTVVRSVRLTPTGLKNPLLFHEPSSFAPGAFLDDDGVYIWTGYQGTSGRVDAMVPTVKKPYFNLDQLHLFLPIPIRMGSPARAQYFADLSDYVNQNLASKTKSRELDFARYLFAKLASPVAMTADSAYFSTTLQPQFDASLRDAADELGIKMLADVPSTSLTREVAVRSMHAALTVLGKFMKADDRAALAAVIRALGQALASGGNATAAKNLEAALTGVDGLLEKVASNPKTLGLLQTVQLSREWLKGQN